MNDAPYLIQVHSPTAVFAYRFRGDQIPEVARVVQKQWKSGLLRGEVFRAVCRELNNVIEIEAWEAKRRERVRGIGTKRTWREKVAALFRMEV